MISSYLLERFLGDSRERGRAGEPFEAESDRMLRIDVDGSVWIKPGAAVAHRGRLSFERLATAEAGSIDQALIREVSPLVRAHGTGRLYCADRGAHVRVVRLQGETLVVASRQLLAFEASLEFRMSLLGDGLGIAAGGFVVTGLTGHGSLALATHGEPLTLDVGPGNSVRTDPHATIAWSGGLTPRLTTDLSWRSAIRHGGQEPIQMLFEGHGFVVVQPFEEASQLMPKLNPVTAVTKLFTS